MDTNFKNLLVQSLKRAQMNDAAINHVVAKFEMEVARTNDSEAAFKKFHDAYANESLDVALAGTPLRLPDPPSELERALDKISSENRVGIDRNSRLEKLRDTIQRMKDKSIQCEVVLSAGEFERMPRHQQDAFLRAEEVRKAGYQATIPDCLRPHYESTATTYKDGSLEVEIKS